MTQAAPPGSRIARVLEIASVLLFLASDDASFVTVAVLMVGLKMGGNIFAGRLGVVGKSVLGRSRPRDRGDTK